MASSEDVIEPLAVSTGAPILSRWRSPQDLIRLNQDKLDGFMSRKGEAKNIFTSTSESWSVNVLILYIAEGHHFMVVHRLPEIKEQGRPYLIPGVPITCRVDNTERHTTRSKVPHLHLSAENCVPKYQFCHISQHLMGFYFCLKRL